MLLIINVYLAFCKFIRYMVDIAFVLEFIIFLSLSIFSFFLISCVYSSQSRVRISICMKTRISDPYKLRYLTRTQSRRILHWKPTLISTLISLQLWFPQQVGAYLSAMSPTEQEEDSLLTLSSVTARPLLAASRKLRADTPHDSV